MDKLKLPFIWLSYEQGHVILMERVAYFMNKIHFILYIIFRLQFVKMIEDIKQWVGWLVDQFYICVNTITIR